jgi:pimeloyl-ACP methyl ester carboxylesterase
MPGLQLGLLVSALVAAAAAQQSDLPAPPGKLVDVGGRRLHLLCSGQGSPAVVLEAGASSFAIDWTLVQRTIEKSHRVCSYDRAGYGWSEPVPTGVSTTAARDLRALLTAAGEKPPYVLVGASRGGLLIRTYLAAYPDDVAGFVFVDSSSEDRLFTMLNGEGVAIASLTAEQLKTTFPTQPVSVPRRKPQTGAPFDRLPPDLYRARVQLDERLIASVPDTVPPEVVATSQERERAMLAALLATRSASPTPFGDRPTVVLSRGDDRNAEREAVHAALAKLSTNSRFSVVIGAGHEIHLFAPDAVVVAIADVATAVRDKTRLPPR